MALFECRKSGGTSNDTLIFGSFYELTLTTGGTDIIDISNIKEITIFNCSRQDSASARKLDIYLDDVLTYDDFPINKLVTVDVSNKNELKIRPYNKTTTCSYIVLLKNAKTIEAEYYINASGGSGIVTEQFHCRVFDITNFKKVTIENTTDSSVPATYSKFDVKLDENSTVDYEIGQGQTQIIDVTNNQELKIYPVSTSRALSFTITIE